jgi:hypothetical protein
MPWMPGLDYDHGTALVDTQTISKKRHQSAQLIFDALHKIYSDRVVPQITEDTVDGHQDQ